MKDLKVSPQSEETLGSTSHPRNRISLLATERLIMFHKGAAKFGNVQP